MKKAVSCFAALSLLLAFTGCQSLGLGVPRGRVVSRTLPSPIPDEGTFETPPGERQMSVYLPPGYDDSDQSYPLLILLHHYPDGDHETFLGKGYQTLKAAVGNTRIDKIADKLINEGRAQPMVIAMPDFSHSYHDNRLFLPYVSDVVLDYMKTDFRISEDRDDIALAGHFWSAREAMDIIMANESLFGVVALYSYCLTTPPVRMLIERNYDKDYPVDFFAYYTKEDSVMSFNDACGDEVARKYMDFLRGVGAKVHEEDIDGDHWEALPLQIERSLEDIFN